MDNIRNVLHWVWRRGGFGWKDVNGLWCDDLGQLCDM